MNCALSGRVDHGSCSRKVVRVFEDEDVEQEGGEGLEWIYSLLINFRTITCCRTLIHFVRWLGGKMKELMCSDNFGILITLKAEI